MPDAAQPDAPEIGYGDALAELEGILDEIEDDAVDVDVLATRVRRAAELLRICRDRIASARVEVTQIVADLDASTLDDPDDATPAEG
jgi:exodeoxyribonuclease VII small subunit